MQRKEPFLFTMFACQRAVDVHNGPSLSRWLRKSLLLLCLACLPLMAASQAPNPTPKAASGVGPFLRIDPGAHTAIVRAAAFDAAKERAYTASDDKTIRVWQLPQGKLVSTYRVPILDGAEGQLYALSLSQDGRWLAVGGWTGWDWEKRASVYIFDTQTEQMVQRLAVATWTITSLRFSPDGQHIAVGMHGEGGLVIVRRSNGQVVAKDADYKNKVMDMDFDRFGRLYAIGLDGFVRLYKQDFTLLARRAVQAAKDAVALRVSPDGERLAIGFADAPTVEVLNARDLSTAGVLKAPASKQKDFVTVGWTSDGQQIYAAGESAGGSADIYRWSSKNYTSAPQVVNATPARINDLWPLSRGRMMFVTDAPSVGWVEASGQVRQPIVSSQWDFAAAGLSLQISANASQVSLSSGGKAMSFSVPAAKLDWKSTQGLQRPLVQASGWSVRIGQDLRTLALNGEAIALEEYEKVRSHAIASNRSFAVVGTEWALRSYTAKGELQWLTRISSPVWAVNVSADNRVVVAAVGDGTLRWFAADTGKELLSIFMHKNSTDWVAWVPGGYYTSSPFGDKHIGWHINRGLDVAPDFVYAVQLERVLYRPDIVRTALDTTTGKTAKSTAPSVLMTNEQMTQMAPPRLKVRLLGIDADKAIARVAVEGERAGPDMQDIAVYVNDLPVTATKDRSLSSSEARQFRREYEVPLSKETNDIRIEAFTGLSMGLARLQVDLPANANVKRPQGDLYVLAIGASQFDQLPEKNWLSFAAKDADTVAAALRSTKESPYNNRYVKVVTDNSADKPTRSNILAALEFIKSAKAQDTVVLFLASHAVSDARGNYYFVPRDVAARDLNGLQAVDSPQTLLSWQVFFDAFRVVAGQRILVVDTCQAKGINGRFDPNALIKRSASSQFALMLASGENEESQEYDPAGHGLFTYGLLSSLKEAQTQKAQQFSLKEWFLSSARIVQKYRDRSLGPQTPQLLAPPVLEDALMLVQQ
jgi:WD40 repeat protein